MAICPGCSGSGGTHGSYKPCYRCGGRGTGGYTNVACMACNGSGRATDREWNTCWTCGGKGTVPDQTSGRAGTFGRANANHRAKGDENRPAQSGNPAVLVFLAVYGLGLWQLLERSSLEGWVPYALALLPAAAAARFWKIVMIVTICGALGYYLWTNR